MKKILFIVLFISYSFSLSNNLEIVKSEQTTVDYFKTETTDLSISDFSFLQINYILNHKFGSVEPGIGFGYLIGADSYYFKNESLYLIFAANFYYFDTEILSGYIGFGMTYGPTLWSSGTSKRGNISSPYIKIGFQINSKFAFGIVTSYHMLILEQDSEGSLYEYINLQNQSSFFLSIGF